MDLILYLMVSALIAFGFGKAIRPVRIWVWLVLALVPLVVTARALVGSAVLAPVELVYQTYPHRAFAEDLGVEPKTTVLSDLVAQAIPWDAASRASWFDREPPLWNPFMLGGDPLAGTVQSAPWEPLFLTSLLLPLGPSFGYLASLTMFLAGLGMYLFLRELELSDLAALFGAVVWTFGGFMTFWLQWSMGLTAVWLPFVILCARRCVRQPGWRTWGILTVVLVWMLLSGHTETAIHIVYAGIVWTIAELVIVRPAGRHLSKVVATGIGAGVASVLLTAFFLAPVIEILPQTVEYQFRKAHEHSDRTKPSEIVQARLLSPVVPFGWGYAGWRHVAEAPEFPLADGAYPGSAGLLVAFGGLFLSRGRIRWWLFAFGVAALLVAAEPPLLANLTADLPGLSMSLNERFDFLTLFALAALAALAIDGTSEKWKSRVILAGISSLVLLTTILVYQVIMATRELPEEFIETVSIRYVVPLIAAAVLFSLPAKWFRVGVLGLFAVVLIQRGVETSWLHPMAEEKQFYPELPILAAIPDHEEPFRIVATADHLLPATATLYGLEDVRGYQALSLMDYRHSFPFWSIHQPVWFNRVDDLGRPFLSALNVRYAIGPPEGGVPGGWSEVFRDESGVLLRNERFLDRAFVPTEVHINPSPDQVRLGMAGETDFGARAWVDHPKGGAEPGLIRNGPGRVVEITAPTVRRRICLIEMDGPGWVVVSEPFWSGWKAFSGGERLALRSADVTFFAFHLEPGTHRVELIYSPRSFLVGVAISLLTLFVIVVLTVWRRLKVR